MDKCLHYVGFSTATGEFLGACYLELDNDLLGDAKCLSRTLDSMGLNPGGLITAYSIQRFPTLPLPEYRGRLLVGVEMDIVVYEENPHAYKK